MKKLIVFVPVANADNLREAIGNAGGGQLGGYSFCSFSTRGTGRFKPGTDSHPAIGKVGELTEVEEERIEFVCSEDRLDRVLAAIKEVHPYEEPAIEVYTLDNI